MNDWVQGSVDRYANVYDNYKLYADVLAKVLAGAAKKLAPLAIVQARPKSIPSFAEKIIRKRSLYKDPLADMTDLCGGRVIAHTAEQVHAVCKFIEEHFTIDRETATTSASACGRRSSAIGRSTISSRSSPGNSPDKDIP